MIINEWCGYSIRFVNIDGEWYAILKDICDALNLRTKDVSQRLDPSMIKRVPIETSKDGLNDIRSRGENKTRQMLAVNELGIYEALFASRRPEAHKFRQWTGTVLRKLRKCAGLEGYEIMRMTEPKIQGYIDHILDTIYYDENTKMLMQSVTIQGGDVEQIPFIIEE
jgi:prophage antirepressor-like protein